MDLLLGHTIPPLYFQYVQFSVHIKTIHLLLQFYNNIVTVKSPYVTISHERPPSQFYKIRVLPAGKA